MKFQMTITFTKLLAFFVAVGAFVLSWLTKDNNYWTIAIPALAVIIGAQDVSQNFGKKKS
jgi:hypothetical protein